jgi:septin family protein
MVAKQDIAVYSETTIQLSKMISTDLEKAVNQYLIFLLTQSGTSAFFETMSPIADIGSSNIAVDLDTFKAAFSMSDLKARDLVEENYPNIEIKITNVVLEDDRISLYMDVTDTTTGETQSLTI